MLSQLFADHFNEKIVYLYELIIIFIRGILSSSWLANTCWGFTCWRMWSHSLVMLQGGCLWINWLTYGLKALQSEAWEMDGHWSTAAFICLANVGFDTKVMSTNSSEKTGKWHFPETETRSMKIVDYGGEKRWACPELHVLYIVVDIQFISRPIKGVKTGMYWVMQSVAPLLSAPSAKRLGRKMGGQWNQLCVALSRVAFSTLNSSIPRLQQGCICSCWMYKNPCQSSNVAFSLL